MIADNFVHKFSKKFYIFSMGITRVLLVGSSRLANICNKRETAECCKKASKKSVGSNAGGDRSLVCFLPHWAPTDLTWISILETELWTPK